MVGSWVDGARLASRSFEGCERRAIELILFSGEKRALRENELGSCAFCLR